MRDKDVVKRDSTRAINTMIKQIEADAEKKKKKKDLNDEDVIKLTNRIKTKRRASPQIHVHQYSQER